MKKNALILLLLFYTFSSFAQTITTTALTSTSFCQNENVNISFSITGSFTAGNIFSAQLSDPTGSFSAPVSIGTLAGTAAGTINATLPNLMTTGTQYRIRVVASAPIIIGSNNGSNLTITGTTTDPSTFGTNEWNVYCYSIATYTNSVNSFDYSNYVGMYTEPNLSFQSTDHWAVNSSPSSAAIYNGCPIANDRYIVQYKREGFPCGKYQINVAGPSGERGFDDASKLVIDGVTVWSNGSCCQAINNAYTGILSPASQIEFVWSENGGESYGRLTFISLDALEVSPDVTICAGSSTTLTASGASSYDWSTNSTYLAAPLNNASVVCSPPTGTASSTETYTVSTTDVSSGCILSSDVEVTINPNPSTSVTPITGSYCTAGTVDVIASGANTYTYSPMASVTLNSVSGHSATLSPTVTTTYTITGSNNCVTNNASTTITVSTPPGNPNDFGSNTWNVYVYSGNNFNMYKGMYVHNTLDFDTRTVWASGSNPSNAAGYSGCSVGNDQHSFRYKREGFPCGYYSLDIPNHDDRVILLINGVNVFSQNSWFANVYKANVWEGYLDANTRIEYTVREFGGGSNGGLAFNYLYGPSNSVNEAVWNGDVSTDWFDSNNWCNNVPSASISALIPPGRTNYPNINASGALAQNIEIKDNASLIISGTNQLEVNGNWNNNGTFTANNSTVVFTGNSLDSITGSSTHLFNNITINKGVTTNALTITSDVTVNGTFAFTNGICDTENNKIILGPSASVSGVSDDSHVNGFVQKTGNSAFIFPVGDGTNYRSISISAPSAVSDHFTASYYSTSPDNATPTAYSSTSIEGSIDHISTCEYWILDRTNGSSDVIVTLSWDATSCGVTHSSELVVSRWDGAEWKDHGNGAITGATISSGLPVDTFSPFTLASSTKNNPLPVEWINFEVFAQNNSVDIKWQTASEVNNDFFTIERSQSGLKWEEITRINGSGNSSTLLSYSAIDTDPLVGTSYYRLKQTDYDGQFKYSESRSININQSNVLTVIPNPILTYTTINGSAAELEYIAVYNILGQDITKNISYLKVNDNHIRINLSNLKSGVYYIQTKTSAVKVYKQ